MLRRWWGIVGFGLIEMGVGGSEQPGVGRAVRVARTHECVDCAHGVRADQFRKSTTVQPADAGLDMGQRQLAAADAPSGTA